MASVQHHHQQPLKDLLWIPARGVLPQAAPVIAAPLGVASGSKWYADWTSPGEKTCKNDRNTPDYMVMVSNAAYWLLEDQQTVVPNSLTTS